MSQQILVKGKKYGSLYERGRNIDCPWMCVGDCNDILYNYENKGGNIRATRKIKRFNDMIEECKLIDLSCQG